MKPLPPGNLWLVHLRRLRAQKRVTVRELAEKADLTPATVNRLENLKQTARPITAQVIADALGVQMSDLLGEEEPTETDPPEEEPPGPAEPAKPTA